MSAEVLSDDMSVVVEVNGNDGTVGTVGTTSVAVGTSGTVKEVGKAGSEGTTGRVVASTVLPDGSTVATTDTTTVSPDETDTAVPALVCRRCSRWCASSMALRPALYGVCSLLISMCTSSTREGLFPEENQWGHSSTPWE